MSIDRTTARGPDLVPDSLEPGVPALVHPRWRASFPWLVQGTTTRSGPEREFDLGLFTDGSPPHHVHGHWDRLMSVTRMERAVHAPQMHEAEVRFHVTTGPGLHVAEPCDGHVTGEPGVLLTVATADCVPVFIVDPVRRVVGVLHAGWRGVAAGVLERGLSVLSDQAHSRVENVYLHLGPSICGSCYEVGADVFRALGQSVPGRPAPVDLKKVLAERAVVNGLVPDKVTVSEHCTRCTGSALFSHRAGDRARHVGYVGIRS